jgi:hypothetical protein
MKTNNQSIHALPSSPGIWNHEDHFWIKDGQGKVIAVMADQVHQVMNAKMICKIPEMMIILQRMACLIDQMEEINESSSLVRQQMHPIIMASVWKQCNEAKELITKITQ